MACKQEVSVQQLQFVVLNRTEAGRAHHFIKVLGTMVRRMRSPMASLRWELAKRRTLQTRTLREPESAPQESEVALFVH